MTLLARALESEALPSLFPSEVRDRLRAQLAGEPAPRLRTADGDFREAVMTIMPSRSDDGHVMFEAVAEGTGRAALLVLAALHHGDLPAFVECDGQWFRLHPSYWEPRHDVADRHIQAGQAGALLWGEDSTSNHPARPIPAEFVSLQVHIPRSAAEQWVARMATPQAAETDARMVPSAVDLSAWASAVGNVPRDKIDSAFLASTWRHDNPAVRPTILEARAALDAKFGKRPRGREPNSNQIR